MILAGIRTALAINVGTVPLAFLIGGGGLGELIFTGIDLMEPSMLLAGAIPTALAGHLRRFRDRPMSVLAGPAGRKPAALKGRATAENQGKGSDMLKRTVLKFAIAAAALMLGAATASAQTIVVGGKNFTEQQFMAEMTAQLLQAKGFKVDKRAGLGTRRVRQAQEAGQVDVYWEYTGTSLITFNKITDKLDPAATYAKVKELDAAKGLVWLNPSKANNTYALAMRKADAAAKGIKSISDLAGKVKGGDNLKFASQRRVLRATGRPRAAAEDLRLRVRPRERGAHGYRPRLPGLARQPG